MSARTVVGRNRASKRRTPKACTRCRDQKIKCSGSDPCQQCSKREQDCVFPDESQKVVVTRRYISDLQEKLAASERRASLMVSQDPPLDEHSNDKTLEIPDDATESYLSTQDRTVGTIFPITPSSSTVLASSLGVHVPTNEAPLTNPLAFHTIDWVPGPSGTPVFMGTSSNWAFNRRVLSMTHEAITGTALSPENLFFDGKVYDLKWDGGRIPSPGDDFSLASLPTQDFAIYLINSVKFHCCRLFYLFEEESFMEHFATFHASAADQSKVPRLWFVHYLILLAFGKAFIVQTSKSHQPPGADLFVQAMKLMPDFTFFECDYIERMQVICCTSLYLHCISCRPAAYRYIGQALSTAFEHGLHTEMQSHHLNETYVQRCRLVWWTIYVLERQMSALMGVPMFISDECVCTPFPIFYEQAQRTSALHIQIKLAQVLGQIHQTVYGIEGQLDSRYLGATKAVLQSIAGLATDLHGLFDIDSSENTSGVSRVSAHLHLQYHQCIVLTTRPLLFIFLQCKLGQSEAVLMQWLHSDSIRSLLQVCTDSSRQIIKILLRLLSHGLLESFLTFDLDATSTAAVAMSMAAAIEPTLISDQAAWSQRVFLILEEMSSHGSKIAGMISSELRQLDNYLRHLNAGEEVPAQIHGTQRTASTNDVALYPTDQALGLEFEQSLAMEAELSTDLLIDIANSLDPESLSWDFPVAEG
ncbi:hypothetical protein HER10_EVM0005103 [Colletotrichum scovillei]|uniref:uncharacterized protein n=1 Tax=Colletotrichum scovillei TaxID=1209932 RepID=UPI0015C3990C|nr:uncharacterized protein HER10_EVM0005103 [Colletotrichum scovillei]KAF4781920.1 hypothetical protein HER10_EVM0005103 [Colletotrichum scovillei]